MLGGDRFAGDLDVVGPISFGWGELGIALEPFDLVLLEQEFNALRQLFYRAGLLALQGRQVEFDLAELHAELGEGAVVGLLV